MMKIWYLDIDNDENILLHLMTIIYRKNLISILMVLGYRYICIWIISNLFVHLQIIIIKMRNILNNI